MDRSINIEWSAGGERSGGIDLLVAAIDNNDSLLSSLTLIV